MGVIGAQGCDVRDSCDNWLDGCASGLTVVTIALPAVVASRSFTGKPHLVGFRWISGDIHLCRSGWPVDRPESGSGQKG
jgi:hypothetical protein